MKSEAIQEFASIAQPQRESFGFIEDIRSPIEYRFRPGQGCPAGETAECMAGGAEIVLDCQEREGKPFPETAFVSLRRVLAAKGIEEKSGGYPLRFIWDDTLDHEEFALEITRDGTTVRASDADGLRRGVYFLEDRICEAEGKSVTSGAWRRKPFVRHRISRCFFGPTNRPPFYIDELTNDVDYYPEEYLNKLAHEGVNGLWLTMYFRDLRSSVFSGRGSEAEKRLAKLRCTARRCLRYGIKIYIFLSEPKFFGPSHFAIPFEDATDHPELLGGPVGPCRTFCTSTEAGRRYLTESIEQIFSAVPELGGVINIMLGEDNGSCIARATLAGTDCCPVCARKDYADSYRELAELFTAAIHKYNPNAEFIGWFYAPTQRDNSEFMKRMLHIAEKWPDNAALMLNFESGGTSYQLNKKRVVLDYSLAYIGPSQLFEEMSGAVKKAGAKIQVGCSHENAAVPFIPVPENLYDKYKFMQEHNVSAVMQCWYFGNYPGLMNKAAGQLSFEPFPENARDFLIALARPEWGRHADTAAQAWDLFSQGYRKFPANIAFEWFGPLHHCIAWPLYLFPEDKPIAPSWTLKNFPEVSGDRIGECLCFHHTIDEALELCSQMSELWQQGVAVLENLRPEYVDNPPRLADIDLAQAIGIQMKSTCNLLKFYQLREDMLFRRIDHLEEMKAIVKDEIVNTHQMKALCLADSRLGYHSEAEGYLFFPEKLDGRVKLLENLLAEDFPSFDISAPWIDRYTGATPEGVCALCRKTGEPDIHPMEENTSWCASYDDDNLYVTVHNANNLDYSLVLEPSRMCAVFRMDFYASGLVEINERAFPDFLDCTVDKCGNDCAITIPLKHFDGFRRPGFPMRFNIYGSKFHWCNPQPWPWRLLHGDYNPSTSGWLIFE